MNFSNRESKLARILITASVSLIKRYPHAGELLYCRKYEVLLRSYEGSDPLKPWYKYISWVEQSFLRDGREGNLYTLLERCLVQFKEDERYLQDRRYIELWIKYVSKNQRKGFFPL